MDNYITLYEKTFSSNDSKNLIKKFEDNSSFHELESRTYSDGWNKGVSCHLKKPFKSLNNLIIS